MKTINLQTKVILQLMNLSSPKFLKNLQKPSPYFFHGALLHRLYGVDAPAYLMCNETAKYLQ